MKEIKIANKIIGENQPTFIIVEIGSNYNKDFETAKKMIDIAKEAGADAVKFQIFHVEGFYPEKAGRVDYLEAAQGKPVYINELVKKAEVPDEIHKSLFDYCKAKGIIYLCTATDAKLADYLDSLGVPAFKVASYELTKYTLIKRLAQKRKPIILSTGAANLQEVADSVNWIREEGNEDIVLLQCVAKYPAPPEYTNLRVMETYEKTFGLPAGLSDHSLNPFILPFAAVAMGAKVIEKHFTLDRNQEGPDHAFAITPGELKGMIKGIREIELAKGKAEKFVTEIEQELRDFTHQSIFAKKDIKKGEKFTEENIDIFRPGKKIPGIEAKHWKEILGSLAKKDIQAQESIKWEEVIKK